MSLGSKTASIGEGAFVAPSAAVIGDVTLGKGSSVWYGTVLRGAHLSPILNHLIVTFSYTTITSLDAEGLSCYHCMCSLPLSVEGK